jgi:hypothetical protein
LVLLGFLAYDKWYARPAIAMAAVTGETSDEPAPVTAQPANETKKGSKRAAIRKFFTQSKDDTRTPTALSAEPTDDNVVVMADTQEGAAGSSTADVEMSPKTKPNWKKLVQNGAAVLLAVYLSSSILNSVVYTFLSTQSNNVELGEPQVKELSVELKKAEERLQYAEIMGYIPSMNEAEFDEKLQEIGTELEEEHKAEMLHVSANTITDAVVGVVLLLIIVRNKQKIAGYFGGISDSFLTLSNSTQAFTLLLVSDTLVGYHSADGWDTVLKVIGNHYGLEAEALEGPISIFVATVPVGLDVLFKFWVFKELRKLSPSTQVILADIDG